MPVQPDTKYEATVKDAFLSESKNAGTPGLFISFETEDGSIDHTFYVTTKTVEKLKEDLGKCFGITQAQLMDGAFLSSIGTTLRGQKVSITTQEKEYNGNVSVAVQWMNPLGFKPKTLDVQGVKRVAGLFGGGPVSSPAYRTGSQPPAANWEAPITDEDVPF